jgi:hypothetical protein
MKRLLPPLVALTMIISSGLVHGVWTGRWATSRALEARVAELGRVPMAIGDWEGRPMALDRRTLEAAEISGYLLRDYENRRDGRKVKVLLVCGRPGPISVHTPEVCYAGSGYEPVAPAVRRRVEAGTTPRPDEFWALELAKPGSVLPGRLQVLYSWNVGGGWKASDRPRLDFGGSPALYKLYVVHQLAEADAGDRDQTAFDFARQLLLELRKPLFSSP